MATGNNAAAFRVGLVADESAAARLIAAVLGCDGLQLAAQAGMPRKNAAGEVPWIDDARVLLTREDIDALLIATAPGLTVELLAQAAAQRTPVWCLPPAGRTFAELTESIGLIRAARIVGRIASWWDLVAEHFDWALRRTDHFRVWAAELYISSPASQPASWQADRGRAGGGVLLHDCYDLLEAAIAILGVPESVHAATGWTRRGDASGAAAEDLALGILRFESGALLGLRATRGVPPYAAQLVQHGPDYSIRATAERLAIVDAQGAVRESRLLPSAWLGQELERFGQLVRGGETTGEATATQERHVAMAAVLEAMYLSARTGQPESPQSFYEVQKWPDPTPGFFE